MPWQGVEGQIQRARPQRFALAGGYHRAPGVSNLEAGPYPEDPIPGGIAIAPACRKTGIAAALLAQLEDIAREAGITEIASDSRIDDAVGADFHLANGFSEAERVTCFVRKIDG